jgi:hypothetical protein
MSGVEPKIKVMKDAAARPLLNALLQGLDREGPGAQGVLADALAAADPGARAFSAPHRQPARSEDVVSVSANSWRRRS